MKKNKNNPTRDARRTERIYKTITGRGIGNEQAWLYPIYCKTWIGNRTRGMVWTKNSISEFKMGGYVTIDHATVYD